MTEKDKKIVDWAVKVFIPVKGDQKAENLDNMIDILVSGKNFDGECLQATTYACMKFYNHCIEKLEPDDLAPIIMDRFKYEAMKNPLASIFKKSNKSALTAGASTTSRESAGSSTSRFRDLSKERRLVGTEDKANKSKKNKDSDDDNHNMCKIM